MKKTTLLIILGIVTIGCIIFGSIKHLGGGMKSFMEYGLKDSDEEDSTGKYSVNEILGPFSSFNVDTEITELRIEGGKTFKAEGSYSREWMKPEISVNNGVLEISQHGKKHQRKFGHRNCRITVTVPEGTNLKDIEIESNVGDIKLLDLTTGNININLNVGEVSVNNVSFETIAVENNIGEISICPEENADNYDISVSTDLGEVNVAGKKYRHSYNSKGNSGKKITAISNVGEINIK